ncbi:MAG: cation:proton antiporter, partial [Roseibacillus sp.]|nr:cation:proton antiporter [Roseibacillus sp.]
MEFLDLAAILLVLAAVFGYLNLKFLKLPTTIGIMLIGLLSSMVLLMLRDALPLIPEAADRFVESIDFNKTLMEGMLSFLLFAGALHVNLGNLLDQKKLIAIMASFGVVFSTFVIGGATWLLFPLFGFEVPFLWCLVFGALISPTDPVAVLSILKTAGAPKSLETKITGESLFNDGVGVVVYLAVLGMA